ncbi:MAG: hypothetical protein JRN51_06905 [Nitrososphaerota archaeon]|jgi:hypothetical protein|nr:hypothetical protein [Nitrososphaerota archaeon]
MFEVMTYLILAGLPVASLLTNGFQLSAETNVALLFLLAYTVLLVLPISKFKLGPSGFEGDIDRLVKNAPSPPPSPTAAPITRTSAVRYENLVDPRSVFLQLSIDIETKLRAMGERSKVQGKLPLGNLIEQLRRREVLTDPWLLDALSVFRKHRNAIVHEGSMRDINAAIDIGNTVLVKLNEIEGSGPQGSVVVRTDSLG